MTTATVSSKGQIVIPKCIREKLSLERGSEVEMIERDGIIKIIRIPEDPLEALAGCLDLGASTKELMRELDEEEKRRDERLMGIGP